MELRLPPIQQVYRINPQNGRFLPGHIPFNKGKKANEYLSAEQLQRNIEIMHKYRKGNPAIGGINKKQVVAIKEGQLLGIYPSLKVAARKFNTFGTNISKVCRKQRKHAQGITFFYEDDDTWTSFLKS